MSSKDKEARRLANKKYYEKTPEQKARAVKASQKYYAKNKKKMNMQTSITRNIRKLVKKLNVDTMRNIRKIYENNN